MDTTYLAAQLAWYLRANPHDISIAEYCPEMWARMLEHPHDVNSNYGIYVWKERQWATAINRLITDPTSRNAIIMFNRADINTSTTVDPVCTTSLQFLIRDSEYGPQLHLIATMRSNDWWHGFCNDSVFFMMLQRMAHVLLRHQYPKLKLGTYFHNVGSLHIYERHFPVLDAICKTPTMNVPLTFDDFIPMPKDEEEVIQILEFFPMQEALIREGQPYSLTAERGSFHLWLVDQVLKHWHQQKHYGLTIDARAQLVCHRCDEQDRRVGTGTP